MCFPICTSFHGIAVCEGSKGDVLKTLQGALLVAVWHLTQLIFNTTFKFSVKLSGKIYCSSWQPAQINKMWCKPYKTCLIVLNRARQLLRQSINRSQLTQLTVITVSKLYIYFYTKNLFTCAGAPFISMLLEISWRYIKLNCRLTDDLNWIAKFGKGRLLISISFLGSMCFNI